LENTEYVKNECSYLLYSGHLNDPAHVWRVHFVLNKPMGETFPLLWGTTIDGQSWFGMLVLALLQIMCHFLKETKRQIHAKFILRLVHDM